MATSKSVIDDLKRMHREGLSQREIALRTDLKKSTVNDLLHDAYSLKSSRADAIDLKLKREHDIGTHRFYVPNAEGKLQHADPVNQRNFEKLRDYRAAVRAYVRGEPNDLQRFKGKSVTIRGEHGPVKMKLLTDKTLLDQQAQSGELAEMKGGT